MTEDLIDKYIHYASDACDAPKDFHRLAGYFLCSTLLGRYAIVVTSYKPEGIRPNVWGLIVGPSRIVRKTTALNLAENIIRDIDEKLILPASFSPESLFEIFGSMERGDCGAWVKDEMGGFFKSLEKRYMYGTREILSMVYVGRGETRKLRNMEFKIPKGIYISALGTIPTPISYYFSDEDFTSGFLNRFIFAFKEMRETRIPLLNVNTLEDRRTEIVETYKELCQQYQTMYPMVTGFSSKSIELLDKYDQEVEHELIKLEKESPGSLWKSYVAETPNHLLKFSVLRRLARGDVKGGILVVDEQDIINAMNDLQFFVSEAREVVAEVQSSARPLPIVTDQKKIDRIYDMITFSKSEGMKFSELLVRAGLMRVDLFTILDTLVGQERVVAYSVVGARGRRPCVFIAKPYEMQSDIVAVGKRVDPGGLRVLLG